MNPSRNIEFMTATATYLTERNYNGGDRGNARESVRDVRDFVDVQIANARMIFWPSKAVMKTLGLDSSGINLVVVAHKAATALLFEFVNR